MIDPKVSNLFLRPLMLPKLCVRITFVIDYVARSTYRTDLSYGIPVFSLVFEWLEVVQKESICNMASLQMSSSTISMLTMAAIAKGQAALAVAVFTVLTDSTPGRYINLFIKTRKILCWSKS